MEVEEGSSTCADCPLEAKCFGLNEVAPNPGYWRLNSLSTNFLKCPNPEACLGGYNDSVLLSYEGLCKEGYQGVLC